MRGGAAEGFFQHLRQLVVELLALADEPGGDAPFGVDDDFGGVALDGIPDRHVVPGGRVPRVYDVYPRQSVPSDRLAPLLRGVVAGDAHDLQFVLVAFVARLHPGESLDAPSAPASPEVEHDVSSAQRREGELLSVGIPEHELRGRHAGGGSGFRSLHLAVFIGPEPLVVDQRFENRIAGLFSQFGVIVLEAVERSVCQIVGCNGTVRIRHGILCPAESLSLRYLFELTENAFLFGARFAFHGVLQAVHFHA